MGFTRDLWDEINISPENGWLEDDSFPFITWSLFRRRHSFIFGGPSYKHLN